MKKDFWGLFHDGVIETITGAVPGTLSIGIGIQYLRQQFPGEGLGFRVDLENCTQLPYKQYDSAATPWLAAQKPR